MQTPCAKAYYHQRHPLSPVPHNGTLTRAFPPPPAAPRQQKLLAVLLRQSCVSIAVSNEYLTLAQPVGAVLLRNGQLPERMLARMLAPHAGSITGCVLGHEVHPMHADVLRNGDAQRLLNQLNGNEVGT